MSEADVQLVREQLDRWNSGDVEGLIANGAPDFEFRPAIAAGVDGGTVRGADEFRRFFAGLDETWEEFELVPEEWREIGDRVFMVARVHAKGRGSGIELDQPLFGVCWLRDGKPAVIQSFLDEDAALAAASRESA